jgi:hypothetical protein
LADVLLGRDLLEELRGLAVGSDDAQRSSRNLLALRQSPPA